MYIKKPSPSEPSVPSQGGNLHQNMLNKPL